MFTNQFKKNHSNPKTKVRQRKLANNSHKQNNKYGHMEKMISLPNNQASVNLMANIF